jgi:hypothetical protein
MVVTIGAQLGRQLEDIPVADVRHLADLRGHVDPFAAAWQPARCEAEPLLLDLPGSSASHKHQINALAAVWRRPLS